MASAAVSSTAQYAPQLAMDPVDAVMAEPVQDPHVKCRHHPLGTGPAHWALGPRSADDGCVVARCTALHAAEGRPWDAAGAGAGAGGGDGGPRLARSRSSSSLPLVPLVPSAASAASASASAFTARPGAGRWLPVPYSSFTRGDANGGGGGGGSLDAIGPSHSHSHSHNHSHSSSSSSVNSTSSTDGHRICSTRGSSTKGSRISASGRHGRESGQAAAGRRTWTLAVDMLVEQREAMHHDKMAELRQRLQRLRGRSDPGLLQRLEAQVARAEHQHGLWAGEVRQIIK